MKDSRGVQKGHCTVCGISECAAFEPKTEKAEDQYCGYCGCAPTKHWNLTKMATVEQCNKKGLTSTESENDNQSSKSRTKISTPLPVQKKVTIQKVKGTRKGSKIPTKIATGSRHSDQKAVIKAPTLSENLHKELIQGKPTGGIWWMLLDECSKHYIMASPGNRRDYNEIGKQMYEHYPTIKMDGSRPWSQFTKCLSRKIRRERMKRLSGPRTEVLENTPAVSKNCSTEDAFSILRPRRREYIAEVDLQTSRKYYEKMDDEIEKQTPSLLVIKECMRKTFAERTVMLRQNVSPSEIVSRLGLFRAGHCVEMEMEILFEEVSFKQILRNMELLAARLAKESGKKNIVASWLEFENSICKDQDRLVELFQVSSETVKEIKAPSSPHPKILVLERVDGENVTNISFFGHMICETTSFKRALLLSIGLLYIFDLPVPSSTVPALGFLDECLLGPVPTN